ncbi:hypothetical protein PP505_gp73 [Gordonia phage Dorito]|uniref:Uncharacterized protein n=1 Tax=Gordonia phage Dorito TaxID=2499023 RepID=A0A3S9UAP6_9CAUD|nr:hypothetical protein PP505_gp73 [Gordonia phage Dorito]AZS07343.1 hypothetical protein PBI_DORITO_73 [Gordonia phage Dorito]
MHQPEFVTGGPIVGPGTAGDSILPHPLELCTYTLPDTRRSERARNLLATINEQGHPMHLPELPDEIHWEDLNRALESVGIPPTQLVEMVIHPNSVTVTYRRTNADGEPLAGSSDSISRLTATIRVRRPKTTGWRSAEV